MTHFKNLQSILEDGGRQKNKPHISVAYDGIQERRGNTSIPCGSGGTLHDYVPFSFAPRSPMLYAIKCGRVAGYSQGQLPLVHLVSSIDAVLNANLSYVFTNGHPIMYLTDFFEDLKDLSEIDWNLMGSMMWNDTSTDLDRKRRRQAEFLVYDFFPWEAIIEIGVINTQMQTLVKQVLGNEENAPPVTIQSNWYYR